MMKRLLIVALCGGVLSGFGPPPGVSGPCLVAHHDGSGLYSRTSPGPLSNFGVGVTVRGEVIGAGAPFLGPSEQDGLHVFLPFGSGALRPLPPVFSLSPPGQAVNASGLTAGNNEWLTVVSDVYGGPIAPNGALGNGVVYPLTCSDLVLPKPLLAPFQKSFRFGFSISLNDAIMVVGAPETSLNGQLFVGTAYAFVNDDRGWVFEAELPGFGANVGDFVGRSVALGGNHLVLVGSIGFKANGFNSNGAVFAWHRRPDGEWVYEGMITEPFNQIGNIWFGYAVAISEDGTTAVITAVNADAQKGAAYVYTRSGGVWQFIQKITPSNPVGSFPQYGDAAALSADGAFLAVANSGDSEQGFSTGALYTYRRNPDTGLFDEVAKILASHPSINGNFASSLDIDGDLLVAGQRVKTSGGVYVFAGVLGLDCNGNGVPDACDIASGFSLDLNGNGIPDECEGPPGDLNGDGVVGVADLLVLLAEWGACADVNDCPADLDGDGNVGVADLLILLANWG